MCCDEIRREKHGVSFVVSSFVVRQLLPKPNKNGIKLDHKSDQYAPGGGKGNRQEKGGVSHAVWSGWGRRVCTRVLFLVDIINFHHLSLNSGSEGFAHRVALHHALVGICRSREIQT